MNNTQLNLNVTLGALSYNIEYMLAPYSVKHYTRYRKKLITINFSAKPTGVYIRSWCKVIMMNDGYLPSLLPKEMKVTPGANKYSVSKQKT